MRPFRRVVQSCPPLSDGKLQEKDQKSQLTIHRRFLWSGPKHSCLGWVSRFVDNKPPWCNHQRAWEPGNRGKEAAGYQDEQTWRKWAGRQRGQAGIHNMQSKGYHFSFSSLSCRVTTWGNRMMRAPQARKTRTALSSQVSCMASRLAGVPMGAIAPVGALGEQANKLI
jgi:hypothetical protein